MFQQLKAQCKVGMASDNQKIKIKAPNLLVRKLCILSLTYMTSIQSIPKTTGAVRSQFSTDPDSDNNANDYVINLYFSDLIIIYFPKS